MPLPKRPSLLAPVFLSLALLASGCHKPQLRTKAGATAPQLQAHSVQRVVDALKGQFSKLALPHLQVHYDYSLLQGRQRIELMSFAFYLPARHMPPTKELRAEIRAALKALGRRDMGCLNVDVGRNSVRYSGYPQALRLIKVYFACG